MEDDAYAHTLNARRAGGDHGFPAERDKRLTFVSRHMLSLPAEVRQQIYDLAFAHSRVAVSAAGGCYCAGDGTGPYGDEHRWLLHDAGNVRGPLRQEAQRAFTQRALWEVHCERAFWPFVARLRRLGPGAAVAVQHIRLNVFETGEESGGGGGGGGDGGYWQQLTTALPGLRSVTFGPWQKSWTVQVAAGDGSDALSDASVMAKVADVLLQRPGYRPLRELIASGPRPYAIHFVFPISYLLASDGERAPRWQLKNWRANVDTGSIDRQWRDVYLVQEATLD